MPSQIREDSQSLVHLARPPLSPRLHSLPDNTLSPLGLLAEASLQNTDGKKRYTNGVGSHAPSRPSPLSLDARSIRGSPLGAAGGYRTAATSDVRGDGRGDDFPGGTGGLASENYFKPGMFMSTLCPLFFQAVIDLRRRDFHVNRALLH